MSDETPGVIETHEGSAGAAQTMDTPATRARAEEAGLLAPQQLDDRQERLRERRRWGGPDLWQEREARGEGAEEEAPDVPETETEDPPAEPA